MVSIFHQDLFLASFYDASLCEIIPCLEIKIIIMMIIHQAALHSRLGTVTLYELLVIITPIL
jgi:hypothetical protein